MAPTGNIPRFIEKLREITEQTPKHIAGWSKDGTVYEVRNELFETQTLPTYFDAKQTMLSFARQLNYYGIKKIDFYGLDRQCKHEKKRARGFVPWAIFHPCLRRDRPGLIFNIKRKTRKEKPVVAAKSSKGSTAGKSEIESVRNELQELVGMMNNDMKHMKQQMSRLENEFQKKQHRNKMEEHCGDDFCDVVPRQSRFSNNLPALYQTTFGGTKMCKSLTKKRKGASITQN